MHLKQAVDSAFKLFVECDVPSPRLNAELLLMFVLGRDRAYLFAHPERELTAVEQEEYEELVRQRAGGCPTQYITGHQEFWGLDLLVSPAVLIPRPETEHVIETVLDLARGKYQDGKPAGEQPGLSVSDPIVSGHIRLLDVGTGSGAIALALATELPQAEVHACDISSEALEMACINAARLGLSGRVQFRRSDLLEAYPGEHFDLVVSNPPYVGESEADKVQKQVREYEPRVAVFSGTEGMEIYRRLIPQAHAALRPAGWLVTEIGFSIESRVKELLTANGRWTDIYTTPDLQGIPRVIAARKE